MSCRLYSIIGKVKRAAGRALLQLLAAGREVEQPTCTVCRYEACATNGNHGHTVVQDGDCIEIGVFGGADFDGAALSC